MSSQYEQLRGCHGGCGVHHAFHVITIVLALRGKVLLVLYMYMLPHYAALSSNVES